MFVTENRDFEGKNKHFLNFPIFIKGNFKPELFYLSKKKKRREKKMYLNGKSVLWKFMLNTECSYAEIYYTLEVKFYVRVPKNFVLGKNVYFRF